MHERNTELSHPSGGYGSGLFEWVHLLFCTAIPMCFLFLCVFQIMTIKQSSMVPTIEDGTKVYVSRCAYFFGKPERGDVVVFYNRDTQSNYVKRIIGLPGDEIRIEDGTVYCNGVAIDEPYINEPTRGEYSTVVPAGVYFCMGDNRNVSVDSRDEQVGFVNPEDILGKVIFSVFPFEFIE